MTMCSQDSVWRQIKTTQKARKDAVEAYRAFIKLIASGKADFFCLRKQANELLKKHKL